MRRQQAETAALSRDAVTEAALDIVDSVGIEGLSMRAIADRLGVKAASLYWHLRDKEQLLDWVAGAILDRIDMPVSRSPWRAQTEAVFEQLVVAFEGHHGRAEAATRSVPALERSRLVRDLARLLASAGVAEPESAAAALVIEAATAALLTAPAMAHSQQGAPMTLAIDSGSWRVQVRSAAAGATDIARSVGGGGAPSVEVRPDGLVVVRNRRGGAGGGVELSQSYTWFIKVHGGTWNTVLDLRGLHISGVELDSGTGNVTCTLPTPHGVVPIRVNSGIVGVTLHRPRRAPVVATVSSGSAKIRLDDRAIRAVTEDVHWDTAGAAARADRYELTVTSGCVRVTMDASAPDGPEPPLPSTPSPTGNAATAPLKNRASLILDGIEWRLTQQRSGTGP